MQFFPIAFHCSHHFVNAMQFYWDFWYAIWCCRLNRKYEKSNLVTNSRAIEYNLVKPRLCSPFVVMWKNASLIRFDRIDETISKHHEHLFFRWTFFESTASSRSKKKQCHKYLLCTTQTNNYGFQLMILDPIFSLCPFCSRIVSILCIHIAFISAIHLYKWTCKSAPLS